MGTERVLRISAARHHASSGSGRAIRQRAQLTVAEIAEAIGVDQGTVRRWEGKVSIPRGDAAARWAEVLEELQRLSVAA